MIVKEVKKLYKDIVKTFDNKNVNLVIGKSQKRFRIGKFSTYKDVDYDSDITIFSDVGDKISCFAIINKDGSILLHDKELLEEYIKKLNE